MMIYKPEYVKLAIFFYIFSVKGIASLNIKKSLRQIKILLSALLFISLTLSSPFWVRDVSAEIETSIAISQGIRTDNFDWNIAGNIYGANPNILSELTWSDLMIVQTKAHGLLTIADKFYLRCLLAYGWITDGDNQDSDYWGDNRTVEFSRSNNSSDDGNVMDVSVGLGYQFRPRNGKFTVTPLIGYSYHEQNFVMTNGYQTIGSKTGPFPGLNSKYEARWMGPWTGVDLSLKIINKIKLSGVMEIHLLADYEGVADWNLRYDFQHPKSFEHSAYGYGKFISTGIDFTLNGRWNIGIITSYQDWSTNSGTSRTYFSDGGEVGTRFNKANWDSLTAEAGITYSF
jgi:hypothetical protein